jgi:hypothetical protein
MYEVHEIVHGFLIDGFYRLVDRLVQELDKLSRQADQPYKKKQEHMA